MKTKRSFKQVSLLMLQCLLSIVLLAQAPLKQWDKAFGGNSYDELTSLQQTIDGGYILGGYSYLGMGGEKTEVSRGQADYWIVKTDANGVKQWDKTLGGNDYEFLTSLQQTTDGGYILGGYSESGINGDKTEARGLKDYWIVKLSSDALPITLLSFTATKTEPTISLFWQTAAEQNNSYFSVQRGNNGSDFIEIGKVFSKGNSTQAQLYSFEDTKPLSGNNYYR
jgi:hypothetical protein